MPNERLLYMYINETATCESLGLGIAPESWIDQKIEGTNTRSTVLEDGGDPKAGL